MRLQEMTNYIRTRYEPGLGETEIEDHINEVYRDLSQLYTPDITEEYPSVGETFDTLNNQATYTLPVPSRSIKQVHLIDGGTRVRLRSMMNESLLYPRSIGSPIRWHPYGFEEVDGAVYQRFGLDPVPDESNIDMAVLYEPIPARLFSNEDIPHYIPSELHYLICWGTLAILAGKNEDYNNAQYWESKYRSAFNEKLMQIGGSRYMNFPEASRRVAQLGGPPAGEE